MDARTIKVKLIKDILNLKAGQIADGYGWWESPENHEFTFYGEEGAVFQEPWEDWDQSTPQISITVTEETAIKYPEYFELIKEEQ